MTAPATLRPGPSSGGGLNHSKSFSLGLRLRAPPRECAAFMGHVLVLVLAGFMPVVWAMTTAAALMGLDPDWAFTGYINRANEGILETVVFTLIFALGSWSTLRYVREFRRTWA